MPPSDKPVTSGGEKPHLREAMETTKADLIRNGASTEYAERKAREAAIRHDRNNR